MLNCRVIGSHAWCLYCQALILQEMCIQIDNIPNWCCIASILTGWHNTNTMKCTQWYMQRYVRLILLTDHDRPRQAQMYCPNIPLDSAAVKPACMLSQQHICIPNALLTPNCKVFDLTANKSMLKALSSRYLSCCGILCNAIHLSHQIGNLLLQLI